MNQVLRITLILVFYGAALGVMAGFSCNQLLKTLWASWQLSPLVIEHHELDNQESTFNLRRKIQKHYLNYGQYIPLEDIIATSLQDPSQQRLNFLMRNACGNAKLYIWVPLKVRLPLVGTRIWEWCWRPRLKQTKTAQLKTSIVLSSQRFRLANR